MARTGFTGHAARRMPWHAISPQQWAVQVLQNNWCYFLNDRGQSEFSANIGADGLQAAMQHAFAILEYSGSSLPNPPRAFEIWDGDVMLFRS